MLTQSIQLGAHHLHGHTAIFAVGHVEDVAGEKLDGLDHKHGTDRRPFTALRSSNTRRLPDRNGMNFQNDRSAVSRSRACKTPVW